MKIIDPSVVLSDKPFHPYSPPSGGLTNNIDGRTYPLYGHDKEGVFGPRTFATLPEAINALIHSYGPRRGSVRHEGGDILSCYDSKWESER